MAKFTFLLTISISQKMLALSLPQGADPEAMIMNRQGVLFVTDSNRGVVYTTPPGGKNLQL